ncbi:MAG: lipid A biosynthesis acyltransferase [Burkholderiaceae bacterium]|nr:lipid A biosynthesis acyltransferase [Burkholderiaceae bacterium]
MLVDALTHLALALLRAVSKLPYPVLRRLGQAGGAVAWRFARDRRRVTLRNLELCFPQWSRARREAVARAHFRYFVRSLLDRFILWYAPVARVRALCRLEGAEHYEKHRGRPVILLAPHFVGCDAGGARMFFETPIVSMYARQKNRVFDAAMRRGRTRLPGASMVLRTDGLRAAVRALRAGTPFYFLPDMDLGARDALFVPFFGVPAATVTSVARLVRLTGAAVVPCVTRMTDDGYVVQLHPAWESFPGDDLYAATRRMNEFIEHCVLGMPAQYLWSHRRFKTRPPGEPGLYGDHDRR